MNGAQSLREVEIPDNFGTWGLNARVNFLANAVGRDKLANLIRQEFDLEEREQSTFNKQELSEIAAKQVSFDD